MNSRERVRAALGHTEGDRIPVDLSSRSSAIELGAYDDLKKYLGIDKKSETFIRAHAVIDEEVLELFGIDTRYIRSVPQNSWRIEGNDRLFIDLWGVPWKKAGNSHYYEISDYIFRDITTDDINKLQWPELITDEMAAEMEAQARELYYSTGYALFTDVLGAGIFESAWYLRGFEQFMVDMALDGEFTKKFLDKILDIQLNAYDKLFKAIGAYLDGVLVTDDLAMQDTLLMSPETYRKILKPYQKQLFEFIQNKGVDVIYHSCGAIYPLLDDLVETGVKILHPVQVSAGGMDPKRLKREYGDRIVFWGGGCDTQRVLQFGTIQEVRDEVKARIEDFAPGGGFIFTPVHCIQPGTPPENIIALFETVKEYGKYK